MKLLQGEGLADAMPTVPIGLIHTAWGGSMIEQWLTNDAIAKCKGADISAHNENLYDNAVRPYVEMAVKGWVYYQGENNCGGDMGNSARPAPFRVSISAARTLNAIGPSRVTLSLR